MAEGKVLDLDQLNKTNEDHGQTILIASSVVAAIFFVMGILDAIGGIRTGLEWIDFAAIGLMAITGPYGFYKTYQYKRIKDIETRLPDFLRDVAEAGRFGMTLADAVRVSSRGRYGSLTPEIRRMAAQIEWGVPATDAMRLFAQRVNTPLVRRMMAIIIKANDAGGNVADVLTMVAHDAREAMLAQEERKIAMATYTVVIYIAFFVFIATIFILNSTFLPKMEEAGNSIAAGAEGLDVSSLPTNIDTELIPKVQLVFVIAVVIHAVGDGILAGVLQDGRIENGMRHSFIMLLTGMIGLRLIAGG
jgi:flagellar protein FlaJ